MIRCRHAVLVWSVLTPPLLANSLNSSFLLPLLQVVTCQHLRSVSMDLLQVPRAWTMIGRRSFAVAGPSLWNRQPFCCSTETRDDAADIQLTTEDLSVPHLMSWQTEVTCTTARRHCCGVLGIPALDIKLLAYLLTMQYTHSLPT